MDRCAPCRLFLCCLLVLVQYDCASHECDLLSNCSIHVFLCNNNDNNAYTYGHTHAHTLTAVHTVTGVTKTESRHESIQATVDCQDGRFEVVTSDNLNGRTFRDVVFCAPPSGFTDYPAAVRDASLSVWAGKEHGGSFVFTSSGGM